MEAKELSPARVSDGKTGREEVSRGRVDDDMGPELFLRRRQRNGPQAGGRCEGRAVASP